MPVIETHFNKPFEEQLEFFRQKGFAFSPNSWKDVWKDGHARAFTVARVTEMSVLEDIRTSLDKAKETGVSFDKWKKELLPKLESKGWVQKPGEKEIITMPDGTKRKRLAPWRFEIIWKTNISTAYHVGRYKQQQDLKHRRPWWQYRITPLIPSKRNRASHKEQDGKVHHADSPYWDQWYPPAGFQCYCYTNTLSNSQLESQGLKPEPDDYKPKSKPDEGWDHNPGQAGLDAWKPDYTSFAPAAATQLRREISRGVPLAQTAAAASIASTMIAETALVANVISRIRDPKINDLLDPADKLRIVDIDVEKADKLWTVDNANYIGTNGQGAPGNSAVKVMAMYETKKPVDASEVDVSHDGGLSFISGGVEFAVLRDMGAEIIPVAMDTESVENAKKAGLIA